MMPVIASDKVNFSELIESSPSFSHDDVQRMVASAVGTEIAEFRRAVDQGSSSSNPTARVRAAIGLFFLGQPQRAADGLEGCHEGIGRFYRGQALSTLEQHTAAADEFRQAAKLGFQPALSKLREAGELRRAGKLDEAEKLIRSTGSEGARLAEYSFQMGAVLFDRGDTFGAVEYFERAVDMDPHHARALFALALQNSLHGNDDEAIKLYERCLAKAPYYVGALLNLGLLYEDKENYGAAQYCFEKDLQHSPGNERALLYLKDIEATSNMYYDEESVKNQQRLEQLLARPVTDFELSVRSRNCLSAMDINSLGDLTRISEQELLSGKNFGETSLDEVRELMKQHGLSIGQNLHDKAREPSFSYKDLSPQEQALMSTAVVDLSFSVRSRKCMSRLGIVTVGDLVQRTPDELLAAKNFGVTSLNEIRQKLGELNIRLRND
jgi:DNA-directed RNA polymerase subunit alpha